jgi:hypothetical protein
MVDGGWWIVVTEDRRPETGDRRPKTGDWGPEREHHASDTT